MDNAACGASIHPGGREGASILLLMTSLCGLDQKTTWTGEGPERTSACCAAACCAAAGVGGIAACLPMRKPSALKAEHRTGAAGSLPMVW